MRALVLLLMLLVGTGVALVLFAPRWMLRTVEAIEPGCLFFVETDQPMVALTIDDGPDPDTTPALLELLERHDAYATFFLIAGRLAGNETLVGALVEGGHEIGNHLMADEPSIALDDRSFEAAVLEASRILSRFQVPRWVRPGSGWYRDTMVGTLERHSLRCALGSIYPFDAQVPWPWLVARIVLANLRPGAVIVLHDHRERGRRTAAVLGEVLPALQARGYRVVTLSELVTAARPAL